MPAPQSIARAQLRSSRSVKVRAAHEVVATRTAKLALLVFQLVPAAGTPLPILALAGHVLHRAGRGVRGGGLRFGHAPLLRCNRRACKFASGSGRHSYFRTHRKAVGAALRGFAPYSSGISPRFQQIIRPEPTPALALLGSCHVQHATNRQAIPSMPVSRRPPCGDEHPTHLPLRRAGRSRPLLAP